MLWRGFRFGAALLLVLALRPPDVVAHDLPLNTVMNAFVKVEPHQAHLVIRVPLDLLHAVPFPVRASEYDLAAAGPATQQALAALASGVPIWEGSVQLQPVGATGRFALPSDRSFEDYDRAAAHVAQRIDASARIYYDQGYFDAHFTYPISSPGSVFSLQTTVAPDLADFVRLAVRYVPLDGDGRAFVITARSGRVPLNPAWHQAASGFVALGIEHILSGIDHLLFLACLVVPLRRVRGIVSVVTAFTIAHSFTLLGSAFHLAPTGAWFPPFVETAIAASIVFMALENIVGTTLRRRWLVTALFGLVHGFGFSRALGEHLQFAGSHLLVSLFSFNLGIELGQLFVLALMLPLLALFRRLLPERLGVIILSAFIAHTGWHWTLERWQALSQAGWPRPDAASLAVLAKWVAGLLLAGGAAHLVARRLEHRPSSSLQSPEKRESGSSTA